MNDVKTADDSPMISVAMCTYNGARFVAEQLESILQQTYRNLEIVIVDDGSADNTVAILESFQQRDARIRLLRNERNLGFLKSFERALSSCTGDFIALADQDDIWFEHKIETLFQELDGNLLVYSNVSMIDEQGQPIDAVFPSVKRLGGHCSLALIMNNCVTGHACLVDRKLLDLALPFPPGIAVHDQWLAIVAGASGRMKASDQFLSLYRKHSSNAVLKNKGKRKVSKWKQKELSDGKCRELVRAMLASGLFDARQTALLTRFGELLDLNRTRFFNRQLARFLMDNQEDFLLLFPNREKAIHKLCRGSWYFRLLLFA